VILEILEIQNFRNCHGVSIDLHPSSNFLIGENNIGKSNILESLRKLFSNSRFYENDFYDPSIPINVNIKFRISEFEIGFFEDTFDSEDHNTITLTCSQEDPDSNITVVHQATGTGLNSRILRSVNFIHYSSLRNPAAELTFTGERNYGAGRFLRSIINRYAENQNLTNQTLIKKKEFDKLIGHINETLSQMKSFSDFNIEAAFDENAELLVRKLLYLKDNKGLEIGRSGNGVQFMLLMTIALLDKIDDIISRSSSYYTNNNGKKILPIIIALDEPEIHLHPFMQRAMIKEFNNILSNQNTGFSTIVKSFFDIDELEGQMLVVTHSPNILLDDYRQLIRLYKENNIVKAISGNSIQLDFQLQKHFLMQFPLFKEAFYAKACIVVEGDTELGSFSQFGNRLGYDFDNLAIAVIQARGDSVKIVMELLEKFGIPAFGIRDSDGKGILTEGRLFVTDKRDFEEELIETNWTNIDSTLKILINDYTSLGDNEIIEANALNKYVHKKNNAQFSEFTSPLKLSEIPDSEILLKKAYYLSWFRMKKSITLGRVIGNSMKESEIPEIYKKAIREAAQNAVQ